MSDSSGMKTDQKVKRYGVGQMVEMIVHKADCEIEVFVEGK